MQKFLGLPNVGKSTLFNALTENAAAQVILLTFILKTDSNK
jgi:ribosome-binding ATPase YchF (GTP1/OBG family)